ncbi:MAG TPA: uridine kinase [Labilithrix sp.]|nr:uridine kinase [Labilithrix sp.]
MQPAPTFRPPLVLGIAGGSGSGKSTIARAVLEALPAGRGVLLQQDHYYRSQAHLPEGERASVNYDHPDALELDLLTQHLDALRTGHSIMRPTYDFTIHDRVKDGVYVEPAAIIVVEGILVLADERLRSRFEVKLYVDTDPDIRVMRRIRRDLDQRGRTFAQVRKQYYESVRPMHLAFVEPSKRFADIVIPEGGQNQVALDFLLSFVRQRAAEAG